MLSCAHSAHREWPHGRHHARAAMDAGLPVEVPIGHVLPHIWSGHPNTLATDANGS
jgi:hypothetical protein